MRNAMFNTLLALTSALLLAACGSSGSDNAAQREGLAAVANGALLVDVRSPEEVKSGMIEGAINIPHTAIVPGLANLKIDKDQPVVVYCRSGNRSGKAAQALTAAGYTHVLNAGGYADLKATQVALQSEGLAEDRAKETVEGSGNELEEACTKPSCA